MKRRLLLGALIALLLLGSLVYYLVRPLAVVPTPASFTCYDLGQGAYVPIAPPPWAFGVGLAYATHIEETASSFDPEGTPPVFEKHPSAAVRSETAVRLPTANDVAVMVDALESGLGDTVREDYPDLDPLLDYEVEMGLVLLDDIDPESLGDPAFAPRLGFFVANDLSARSVQLLGEGQDDRYAFWGVAKSFPGFMPIADRAWVPERAVPNGIPCVELETRVNGELRQRQSTEDLVYTPREMLRFVHAAFPEVPLTKGTIVLTGTPGGVAMTTPRWLVRLANLLGLSRFRKLSTKLRNPEPFLQPGDRVTVRAQGLGKVHVTIVP